MRTKTILAATFIVPLLVLACNRENPAPSANASVPEKQAMAPSMQDKPREGAPLPSGASSDAAAPAGPAAAPSSNSATTPSAAAQPADGSSAAGQKSGAKSGSGY